jgi:hypothetical protein
VIRTAQAGLFIPAEPQRHATVRAKLVNQAEAPIGIPKGEQAFRQDFHPHRRALVFGKLFGQQRGQPIAAEHVAHRRSRPGLGQKIVLVFAQHGLCRLD